MIVAVCVDDLGGMMFNDRRQSRDRLLIKDLLNLAQGSKLWIAPCSLILFKDCEDSDIEACEDFLDRAGQGEYAFVEDRNVSDYLEKIEEIVVYKWNRRYPRDLTFNIDLNEWSLTERTEFPGSSHESITREIYKRP